MPPRLRPRPRPSRSCLRYSKLPPHQYRSPLTGFGRVRHLIRRVPGCGPGKWRHGGRGLATRVFSSNLQPRSHRPSAEETESMEHAGSDIVANEAQPLYRQAEQELDRSGLRLAFPPPLEARHRRDTAAERSRDLRLISQIGATLYFATGFLLMVLVV